MSSKELLDTATALLADDKGLLTMDESNPTCNKRLAKLGIPQTEEAHLAYRELIETTLGLVLLALRLRRVGWKTKITSLNPLHLEAKL